MQPEQQLGLNFHARIFIIKDRTDIIEIEIKETKTVCIKKKTNEDILPQK